MDKCPKCGTEYEVRVSDNPSVRTVLLCHSCGGYEYSDDALARQLAQAQEKLAAQQAIIDADNRAFELIHASPMNLAAAVVEVHRIMREARAAAEAAKEKGNE